MHTVYLRDVNMSLLLVMEDPLILWWNNYLVALVILLNNLFGAHPCRLYDEGSILVLIDLLLIPRWLCVLILIIGERVVMRAMSKQLLALLIFDGLEWALKVEPVVCLPLDVVRHDLPILYEFELLSDAVTCEPLLLLINLYATLEVRDLRARAINIFCPQVTMVVLFHDWLDQYSRFWFVNLSDLHEVPTAHSAHYIRRVDWISLLLEMFLPANYVILE